MIYIVTKQELSKSSNYRTISVEDSLSLLNKKSILGLDTETEGFSPISKKLLLLQIGDEQDQVIIDCTTIKVTLYKELLESDKLFLGWNIKFDAKFLMKEGIILNKVYDGYLAEKLLWLGYPRGTHSASLASAVSYYMNETLNKNVRQEIITSFSLTESIITYSALDVKYLIPIKKLQEKALKEKGIEKSIIFENNSIIPIAYMEFCGIKLDINKWKEKLYKNEADLKLKLEALNEWILNNKKEYITTNYQGDLFKGFNTNPICTINWDSPSQVIPLFESLGFNLIIKSKGVSRKSVEAKVLKAQKHKSPLAELYIDYKEASKITSTYGEGFIDSVNPITERVYTRFNSLGTVTARLSCGGGTDKETYPNKTLSLINFQNLPANEETRSCFIAESGNKWVSCDYCGQESFIMASIANDKEMLEELTKGSGDLHSLTAKMVFKDIPKSLPTSEIKKAFPQYRQAAKGYEFAFYYGGDDNTLVQNFNIDKTEAKSIYNDFMVGFSGLKKYQDFRKKDVLEKGYIDLGDISGYKVYIWDWEKLQTIKKRFNREFWNYYNQAKIETPDCDTVQDVKYYFRRISKIKNDSINYPIQHAGAMCFKVALAYFFNYLKHNNLVFKVKICIGVHDEINIEAPINIVENVAKVLRECMIKAGSFFCTRAKLDVSTSIGDHWIH